MTFSVHRPGRRPRHRHRACRADGVEPRRRRALLHRAATHRGRDRAPAGGRDAVVDELSALQHDLPARGAARAERAAGRAPDAAAGRGADRRHQALDPRSPLQRRVGAVDAARSAVAPVRRHGRRLPARAQGRPRAGGRAHPRAAGARVAYGAAWQRRRSASARLRWRRPAGADRERHLAGRHAAVQAQRLHRLRHRRRRPHLAHRHRRAQHGHPGGGRRARGEPPGAPGRLDRHRRRRRRGDRQPVADRAGGIPLQAAPERTRARALVDACATRPR